MGPALAAIADDRDLAAERGRVRIVVGVDRFHWVLLRFAQKKTPAPGGERGSGISGLSLLRPSAGRRSRGEANKYEGKQERGGRTGHLEVVGTGRMPASRTCSTKYHTSARPGAVNKVIICMSALTQARKCAGAKFARRVLPQCTSPPLRSRVNPMSGRGRHAWPRRPCPPMKCWTGPPAPRPGRCSAPPAMTTRRWRSRWSRSSTPGPTSRPATSTCASLPTMPGAGIEAAGGTRGRFQHDRRHRRHLDGHEGDARLADEPRSASPTAPSSPCAAIRSTRCCSWSAATRPSRPPRWPRRGSICRA